MAEPRHHSASTPPDAGARLPALTPAGRELLEVLWRAGRPLTTRQLQDAIAHRFPHRDGRKIQTVSTLLAEVMAQGWVAGEKRGGTRWVYRPAVSRGEGLSQLARLAVGEFCAQARDGWYLVREALSLLDLDAMPSNPRMVCTAEPRRRSKAPAPAPPPRTESRWR